MTNAPLTLDLPLGGCRLCDATTEQRSLGAERSLSLGQSLMRCGHCGGLYLDADLSAGSAHRFHATEYRRLYLSEAATRYDAAFLRSLRAADFADRRAARLLPALPLAATLLEIGSGYGAFLGRIHAARPDLFLFAIEPDLARRELGLDGAPVRFIEEAGVGTARFDLIVAFHSLEHLSRPAETLRMLRSALKPGGRLVIEVPDAEAAWSSWREVHPAHLSYFTQASLTRLLRRAGLAPMDPPSSPSRFAGSLWIEARAETLEATGEAQDADAEEIARLDAHVLRYAWRPRDAVKRGLTRLAVRAFGPERVGGWKRRRAVPALDRALASEARLRITLSHAPLDCLTFDQFFEQACAAMRNGRTLRQSDVNVAKLIAMQANPTLQEDVATSELISADGMGIVWGARLLGLPVPERVTGIDLMTRVIAWCAATGRRPYLLGASDVVLQKAVERLREQHPTLVLAGSRHGYFTPEEENEIVDEIRASGADCLFVGISSPAKERFLARHHDALGAPYRMGVGGAFDVVAGLRWRAPRWMQACGLEWVARLIQEPRRLGLMYLRTNLAFALLLFAERRRIRRRSASADARQATADVINLH
ncbi:MAG: WecB/TagA/CpsF family glycosyltransferase [Elsteraceae bacterium]